VTAPTADGELVDRRGGASSGPGEHLALGALALVAALVYGWHLERQGWGNAYYAATAQAGASSWKAFYFGSIDAGGALATDKPPVGLWPMAAAVRAFGLSPWSVIGPQLVQAVVAVVVLARTVRRSSGPVAGLIAGAVLACTPVFVVLARFDDPDMTVTLLSVCVAYTTLRHLEHHDRRWMAATGALVGLLFLTKWGAGLLIVPAVVAAVWSARAQAPGRRAAPLLLAAGVAAGVTAIWLPAVLFVPARLRPYQDASGGSVLNLVVGQNGLSRMVTRVPESLAASSVSGTPGPLRLFQHPFPGQVGWLLPLALVLTVVPWALRRSGEYVSARPGTRTAHVFWTWWLLTTAVVFSAMGGPMHPYYTVLMTPAIAALVGTGLVDLWRAAVLERHRRAGAALALVLAGTLLWEAQIAARWPALAGGTAIAVFLAWAAGWVLMRRRPEARTARLGSLLVGPLVVVAMLAGPVGYSLATDAHAVTGANPLGGPEAGPPPVVYPPALVTFLKSGVAGQTWAAVTPRATAASTLALATRRPVLTLGGFVGNVPFPTLAAVQGWVRLGRVRYLVVSATSLAAPPPRGAPSTESGRIVAWGVAHGCRVPLPERAYVVVDLARRTCALGRALPVGPVS